MKHETATAMQLSLSQAQHTPAECIDTTYLLVCVCVCVCIEVVLTELCKGVCLRACVRRPGLLTHLSSSSFVRLVKSNSLSWTCTPCLFWPSPHRVAWPAMSICTGKQTHTCKLAVQHARTLCRKHTRMRHTHIHTHPHTHTKAPQSANDLCHGNTQQRALGNNWDSNSITIDIRSSMERMTPSTP